MCRQFVFAFWLVSLALCVIAEIVPIPDLLDRREEHINASSSEIAIAWNIVRTAQNESARLNGIRMENPARNRYWAGRRGWSSPPPLMEVIPEIARAANLLSDLESSSANDYNTSLQRRSLGLPSAGKFWMETLTRRGTVPWGDDANYKVRISRVAA